MDVTERLTQQDELLTQSSTFSAQALQDLKVWFDRACVEFERQEITVRPLETQAPTIDLVPFSAIDQATWSQFFATLHQASNKALAKNQNALHILEDISMDLISLPKNKDVLKTSLQSLEKLKKNKPDSLIKAVKLCIKTLSIESIQFMTTQIVELLYRYSDALEMENPEFLPEDMDLIESLLTLAPTAAYLFTGAKLSHLLTLSLMESESFLNSKRHQEQNNALSDLFEENGALESLMRLLDGFIPTLVGQGTLINTPEIKRHLSYQRLFTLTYVSALMTHAKEDMSLVDTYKPFIKQLYAVMSFKGYQSTIYGFLKSTLVSQFFGASYSSKINTTRLAICLEWIMVGCQKEYIAETYETVIHPIITESLFPVEVRTTLLTTIFHTLKPQQMRHLLLQMFSKGTVEEQMVFRNVLGLIIASSLRLPDEPGAFLQTWFEPANQTLLSSTDYLLVKCLETTQLQELSESLFYQVLFSQFESNVNFNRIITVLISALRDPQSNGKFVFPNRLLNALAVIFHQKGLQTELIAPYLNALSAFEEGLDEKLKPISFYQETLGHVEFKAWLEAWVDSICETLTTTFCSDAYPFIWVFWGTNHLKVFLELLTQTIRLELPNAAQLLHVVSLLSLTQHHTHLRVTKSFALSIKESSDFKLIQRWLETAERTDSEAVKYFVGYTLHYLSKPDVVPPTITTRTQRLLEDFTAKINSLLIAYDDENHPAFINDLQALFMSHKKQLLAYYPQRYREELTPYFNAVETNTLSDPKLVEAYLLSGDQSYILTYVKWINQVTTDPSQSPRIPIPLLRTHSVRLDQYPITILQRSFEQARTPEAKIQVLLQILKTPIDHTQTEAYEKRLRFLQRLLPQIEEIATLEYPLNYSVLKQEFRVYEQFFQEIAILVQVSASIHSRYAKQFFLQAKHVYISLQKLGKQPRITAEAIESINRIPVDKEVLISLKTPVQQLELVTARLEGSSITALLHVPEETLSKQLVDMLHNQPGFFGYLLLYYTQSFFKALCYLISQQPASLKHPYLFKGLLPELQTFSLLELNSVLLNLLKQVEIQQYPGVLSKWFFSELTLDDQRVLLSFIQVKSSIYDTIFSTDTSYNTVKTPLQIKLMKRLLLSLTTQPDENPVVQDTAFEDLTTAVYTYSHHTTHHLDTLLSAIKYLHEDVFNGLIPLNQLKSCYALAKIIKNTTLLEEGISVVPDQPQAEHCLDLCIELTITLERLKKVDALKSEDQLLQISMAQYQLVDIFFQLFFYYPEQLVIISVLPLFFDIALSMDLGLMQVFDNSRVQSPVVLGKFLMLLHCLTDNQQEEAIKSILKEIRFWTFSTEWKVYFAQYIYFSELPYNALIHTVPTKEEQLGFIHALYQNSPFLGLKFLSALETVKLEEVLFLSHHVQSAETEPFSIAYFNLISSSTIFEDRVDYAFIDELNIRSPLLGNDPYRIGLKLHLWADSFENHEDDDAYDLLLLGFQQLFQKDSKTILSVIPDFLSAYPELFWMVCEQNDQHEIWLYETLLRLPSQSFAKTEALLWRLFEHERFSTAFLKYFKQYKETSEYTLTEYPIPIQFYAVHHSPELIYEITTSDALYTLLRLYLIKIPFFDFQSVLLGHAPLLSEMLFESLIEKTLRFSEKEVISILNVLDTSLLTAVIQHCVRVYGVGAAELLHLLLSKQDFLMYQEDKSISMSTLIASLYTDSVEEIFSETLSNEFINLYLLEHHPKLTFSQVMETLKSLSFVPYLLSENTLSLLKHAIAMPKYHQEFSQLGKENSHIFLQLLLLPSISSSLKYLLKDSTQNSPLVMTIRTKLKTLTPFELVKFLSQYYESSQLGRHFSEYQNLLSLFYLQLTREKSFVLSTAIFQLERQIKHIQSEAKVKEDDPFIKEALDTLKTPFTQGNYLTTVIQDVMTCAMQASHKEALAPKIETLFEKQYNRDLTLRFITYYEASWSSNLFQILIHNWDQDNSLWIRVQNQLQDPQNHFQMKQILDKVYAGILDESVHKLEAHQLKQYISSVAFLAAILEEKREGLLRHLQAILPKSIGSKNSAVVTDLLNSNWLTLTEKRETFAKLFISRNGRLIPTLVSDIKDRETFLALWDLIVTQLPSTILLTHHFMLGSDFDETCRSHFESLYQSEPNGFLALFESLESAYIPYMSLVLYREVEKEIKVISNSQPAIMHLTSLGIRRKSSPYLKSFTSVLKKLQKKAPHSLFWMYNMIVDLSRLHTHTPYISAETTQELHRIGLIDNQGLITGLASHLERHAYLQAQFKKVPHAHQIAQIIKAKRSQLSYFLSVVSEQAPEFYFNTFFDRAPETEKEQVLGIRVIKEPQPFLSYILNQIEQSQGHFSLLRTCLTCLSESLAGKQALSAFLQSLPLDQVFKLIQNPSQSIRERIQLTRFLIKDLPNQDSQNATKKFRREHLASALINRLYTATNQFKESQKAYQEVLVSCYSADPKLFLPIIESFKSSLPKTFVAMIMRLDEAQDHIQKDIQRVTSRSLIPMADLCNSIVSYLDRGFTVVDLLLVSLILDQSYQGLDQQFSYYLCTETAFPSLFNESEYVETNIFLHAIKPGKQLGRVDAPLLKDSRANTALVEALEHAQVIDSAARLSQTYKDIPLEQLNVHQEHYNPAQYISTIKRNLDRHSSVLTHQTLQLELYYKLIEEKLEMAETYEAISTRVSGFFKQFTEHKLKGILSPEYESIIFSFFSTSDGFFDFEYTRSFVNTISVPLYDSDLIKNKVHEGRAHAMILRLHKHGLITEKQFLTPKYYQEGLLSLARVIKGSKGLEAIIEKSILKKRQVLIECLFIQFHLHILLNTQNKQRWTDAFLALFHNATPHRWALITTWMTHHKVHITSEIQLKTMIEQQTGQPIIKLSATALKPILERISNQQEEHKAYFQKLFDRNDKSAVHRGKKENLSALLSEIQQAV